MPEERKPSADTLSMQIQQLNEKLEQQSVLLAAKIRREDTGSQRVNTDALLSEFQGFIEGRARKIVRNWLLGLMGGTAVCGGGGSAWYLSRPPPTRIEPEEIKNTVESSTQRIDDRVEENSQNVKATNRKIRNLGREIIRIGDAQAEAVDYLSDKLDAISSRAQKIDVPPTIKTRRLEKRQSKLDKRVDQLIGPEDEE